ncbi:MAG: DUF2066 domain-containing protein [Alphaproteobacteria bacterium]|nr:DUF2066 domain-containing protein [Alphaproteobacteria bacterium]MDH5558637.1 DUF2066 domain-containing protein [Alphaproteobacteria bacterium]
MMNRRFFPTALAALAFVVLCAGPVSAQDLFEVNGLKVDERADDEVQAKFSAIESAQQRALQIVLRRLVQPEDIGRLPEIEGQRLALMVRDYDIADEKLGGGRYLATISVRFLPEELSNALRDAKIPFAMARSRPVVVLPVLDTGSARRLWDDPNPWRLAWAGRTPHPGLFSVMMPAGDLSDVAAVNVNQAISADPAAMRAVSQKYQASGAMIAMASIGGNKANRSVTVTLMFIGGSYDGETVEQRYKGSGDLTAFLGQVVTETLDTLERDWKQNNMLDFSQMERMSVLVPIEGLGGWRDVRERLDGMPRIQSISMARMSQEEVELDLVYVGSTDQLRAALAQQNLELVFSPDRPLWLLRRIGGN